jgi:putative sigma-54 modulation protein
MEVLKHHRKGNVQRFEMNVYMHDEVLRAEYTGEDMREAIDLVIPKITRQIKKKVEKNRIKDRGLLRKLGTIFSPFKAKEAAKSATPGNIVRRKKQVLSDKINEQEAVRRLNDMKQDFYLFQNSETNKINLVYRSGTEKYGIIEIETKA